MGLASTLGYWLVIMYCLRIGPTGPTVAMNNMGMLWAVLLGSLWLKPQPLSGQLVLGLGLVSLAISVMGFGSSQGNTSGGLRVSTMSLRWFVWALLGWVLAGISMTAQFAAGISVPNDPAAVVFAASVAAVALLVLPAFHGGSWRSWRELIAGSASGMLMVVIGISTLTVLRSTGPEIVFPVTTAMPAVLILVLGYLLYDEHLGLKGMLACVFGIAGVTILSRMNH